MIKDPVQQCKHWALLSLLNFVLVSLLGVLLRYKIAFPLPGVNYKYLLNAHSHFAFAGWVSMAIFTAFVYMLSEETGTISSRYRYQFNLAQIANFGMLLSFPFEGYAAISIGFSCLFILFSYWFAWQYWKDLAKSKLPRLVKYFAKASLFFFVLSSTGPYLLGYILSHRIYNNNLYQNSIYLFLHFQYNGWFSFGVLAIFFRFLYSGKIPFDEQKGMLFFWILFAACIPAYCLSLLWTSPPFWVFLLAALAGFAQLAGAGILVGLLLKVRKELTASLSALTNICWQLSLLAFCIKILLQALSAIPALGKFAFGIRPVIIGYLHLVMLGFISLFLVGYFLSQNLFRQANRFSKTGLAIFILGVLANEIFLLLQGIFVLTGNGWVSAGYWLFAAAIALFAGLSILFLHEFQGRGRRVSPLPVSRNDQDQQ
jgi:hypothetical protein